MGRPEDTANYKIHILLQASIPIFEVMLLKVLTAQLQYLWFKYLLSKDGVSA